LTENPGVMDQKPVRRGKQSLQSILSAPPKLLTKFLTYLFRGGDGEEKAMDTNTRLPTSEMVENQIFLRIIEKQKNSKYCGNKADIIAEIMWSYGERNARQESLEAFQGLQREKERYWGPGAPMGGDQDNKRGND
jgi:hypothetical protein